MFVLLHVLLMILWGSLRCEDGDTSNNCARGPSGRKHWLPWSSSEGHLLPISFADSLVPGINRTQPTQEVKGKNLDGFSASIFFNCVKTDGVDPPPDLTSFTTRLLHEHDVTHYVTWRGHFLSLGSGMFADVHLGRLWPSGQCVVVKKFEDYPLATIEQEIRIHRYIEQALPSTPRLLGLLPSLPDTSNSSLVYQLVPDSVTLHDWLRLSSSGLSPVQWLSVALQLAKAVEALHRKCILHNDIHSENVLVNFPTQGYDGVNYCGMSRLAKHNSYSSKAKMLRSLAKVKATNTLPKVTLIDFGYATFRKGKVYSGSEESQSSCRHLAPEVLQNSPTSPASDVFSLGQEFLNIADLINSSSLKDLAEQCTSLSRADRPPAAEVVHKLRGIFINWQRQSHHRAFLRCQEKVSFKEKIHNGEDCLDFDSKPKTVSDHIGVDPFLQSHQVTGLFSERVDPPPTCTHTQCSYSDDVETLWKEFHPNCDPEVVENALSKTPLPYIPSTGDLSYKTSSNNQQAKVFDSDSTVIYRGQFRSTSVGQIIVKSYKNDEDYLSVRHEALVNAYLNETGWVPKFYGVTPLSKRNLRLGIVQELFAEGVTLQEVLDSGRPVGFTPRVELAFQLTSMLHEVHSRQLLINNFKSDNVLCCTCMDPDRNCSTAVTIKLIDLAEVTGCEGKHYDHEEIYLRHFRYLAPEVIQNGLTTFRSDVFSLCVMLNVVLDTKFVSTFINTTSSDETVGHFLAQWSLLSSQCRSDQPEIRPTTVLLKRFFGGFLPLR